MRRPTTPFQTANPSPQPISGTQAGPLTVSSPTNQLETKRNPRLIFVITNNIERVRLSIVQRTHSATSALTQLQAPREHIAL